MTATMILSREGAMKYVLAMVLGLLAFRAVPARAEDPFVSRGFLTIPAEVDLGAMSAVAVDAKDNIYVLHRGTPPLLAFDSAGKYRAGWGKGLFKVPHGLRVDGAGNVWTTDNGNHLLRKFSPDGKLLQSVGEAGGKVQLRAPDDLVFSSKGEIYVADSGNGRIVKLSPDGQFLAEWGRKGKANGEFATAHGLAIDKQDRIYVADRGNRRVQVFDAEGKHVASWGGFGNPFGLLVVGDELLVTEGDIHQVFHLNRKGEVAASWGNAKLLQLPHLMAIDSKGTLYIAEVNGKRVQLFGRK